MEIHVGDIVKVKSGSQGGNGNGVSQNNTIAEIVDYNEYNNKPGTSGLIDDMYTDMYIIKFEYNGYKCVRRIIKDHIIEIVESVHSNIKYTTEDYNYLIPLLTELNTT